MKAKKTNFRQAQISTFWKKIQRMNSEEQVLFGSHFVTLVACFLPWVSFDPLYGPTSFQNAFTGATWLLGSLVFVISLGIILIFSSKLLEKNFIPFHIPENSAIAIGSTFSLILLVCTWSVLRHVGLSYAGASLRFGLALCLISQIASLVALWLQAKSQKKENVQDFFQLPSKKKSRQSHGNQPKK